MSEEEKIAADTPSPQPGDDEGEREQRIWELLALDYEASAGSYATVKAANVRSGILDSHDARTVRVARALAALPSRGSGVAQP